MAARGALSVKILKTLKRALKSALFEWVLIFMLFINAIFSYVLTKFANYCELQSPCLLCSRLDHLFGNKKLKYYWDLICTNHKLEISSLVFCHAHDKLDVHGMCESCLFSFGTINNSNAETYRLLVGKLGENSCYSFNEDPLLEDDNPAHSSTKKCSCCNEPWLSRGYSENLWSKSGVSEAAEPAIPLQVDVGHREYETHLPIRTTDQENIESHPLSHIPYAELKVNSETGSEADSEDETISLIHEADKQMENHANIQLDHSITSLSDAATTEKLLDPAFALDPSGFISKEESDLINPHDGASSESTVASGHGLEELNWQPSNCKTDTSVLPELISLSEVTTTLSNDEETRDVSIDSKLIPEGDASPSSNANESFLGVSKASKILPLDDIPSSSNEADLKDEISALIHEADNQLEDHANIQLDHSIISLSVVAATEKLLDRAFALDPSAFISKEESDVINPRDGASSESTVAVGRGLEELNWQPSNCKTDMSVMPELISLSEVTITLSSDVETCDVSIDSKLIPEGDASPSSNANESFLGVSKASKILPLDDIPSPSNEADSKDEISALIHEADNQLEDHANIQLDHSILSLSDVAATEKLLDPAFASVPFCFISKEESDVIKPHDGASSESYVAVEHEQEDLNWQPSNCKTDISVLPEVFSLPELITSLTSDKETLVDVSKDSKIIPKGDVSPSSNANESFLGESKASKILPLDDIPSSSNANEDPLEIEVSQEAIIVSLEGVLPSSEAAESPTEGLKKECVTNIVEVRETTVTESEKICEARIGHVTTEAALETNPSTSNLGVQVANTLDLSDAYKIAVGNRGKQQSDLLAEQWTSRDSSRLSEDLKALLSQLSARGLEQSLSDINPKLFVSGDELRTPDASSSNGIQLLQRRISLERNESNLSLDGSLVSEIEGESEMDRLKRQVEHDRKLLSAMYKELEEERNASAVAVNQAMAMITRLQEDKATLQMNALQNIRIMEEQAEYDLEALQKTNDLLAEKEKEIQDLEAALEFYRHKFSNETVYEYVVEGTSDLRATEKEVDNSEGDNAKESLGDLNHSVTEKPTIFEKVEETNTSITEMDKGASKNSLLGFEDETLFILQSLKKIENKLHLFSNNGIYSDLVNVECSESEGDLEHDQKNLNCKGKSQVNSEADRNKFSVENNIPERGGSPHGENLPVQCRDTDLSLLENEISDLNEKLETLKADQNFLEHAINSLRDEEEGQQFIRDIASHLQALRRIGIRRKNLAST